MKQASSKGHVHRISISRDEAYKAALYRWEFLRRNPEYGADYKKFRGSFGAWLNRKGHLPDSGTQLVRWTKSDRKYFQTKIEPVLTKLCRKWHVFNLFPPELGLEEGLRASESVGGQSFPPTWYPWVGHRDFSSVRSFNTTEFTVTSTLAKRYENLLNLQLDLDSPMKDLLNYVSRALKFARKTYLKEQYKHGLRPPRGRRRFEDYDMHLRVWDLKQTGNRPVEIARLIFSQYDKESGIHKVRDHLEAAEKLIRGHYREIR